MSSEVVPSNALFHLGDILVQTSSNIYDDLQNLILSLRSLTPELRYVKLKTFFNITKKKLIQLLCVTKWLTINNNINYINNLNSLKDQLSQIENLLNEAEYSLYCTHSHLFSRRVRSLNVIIAKDILARRTYPYIPIEVFTCGIEPIIKYNDNDINDMNKRLAINIRAKLALYDNIPKEIIYSSIIDGILILKLPYLYEVGITLSYANEQSPWKVIGFRILADINNNENIKMPKNLYDQETYENDVLKIISKANNNNDNNNNDDNNNTTTTIMKLDDIHKICIHASLAISLRLLFLLGNVYTKTTRKDMTVDFSEGDDGSSLKISFWKSPTTGYLLYELRVNHYRINSSTSSSLSLSSLSLKQSRGTDVGSRFFVELWSRHQSNDKLEFKRIHGIHEYINAEDFVNNGSLLSLLLSNVLAIIAESKLKILLARLLITPEVITSTPLGLKITFDKEKRGLVISFGSSSSSSSSSEMIIGLDNQYGEFKVRYGRGISTHTSIDIFLKEINNIESEDFIIKVQEDAGINGTLQIDHNDYNGNDNNTFKKHLLKPYLTAEVVLFQLAVNHWAHLMKRVSELEPVTFNATALLESNGMKTSGECLVFELLSGRNAATITNDVMSHAMNMIPETYMLSPDIGNKRSAQDASLTASLPLLKRLKPNELIVSGPDHFLYLVLVIDKSFSATLTALLCGRNSNPLYLPIVKASVPLNTLLFHNDNNYEIKKAINNAYEWQYRTSNNDVLVRPYTVAMHISNSPNSDNEILFMSYFSDVSVTVLIISQHNVQIRALFLLLNKALEKKKEGLVPISSSTLNELLKNSQVLLEAMISLRQSSSLLLPIVESVSSHLKKSYDAVCHQHLNSYFSLIESNANDIFTAIIDSLHKGRVLLEFYCMMLMTQSSSSNCINSVNLIHYNNICDPNEISMMFAVIPNSNNANKDIANFIKVEAKFPEMLIVIDNNGDISNVTTNDINTAITNILN